MVRKMAYIGTCFIIGLFCASFLTFKQTLIISVGILLIGISYGFIINHKSLTVCICLVSVGIGIFVYGIYNFRIYEPLQKLEGYTVIFEGRIDDIDYYGNDKALYKLNGKINNTYNTKLSYYGDICNCKYDDFITINGTAERNKSSYLFDEETYNKSKGIYISIADGEMTIKRNENFSLKRTLLDYRDYMLSIVKKYLPGDEGSFLCGMIFGDKSGLNTKMKTSLYRTGIGHIMSVSGVHLSIIAMFLMLILKRIGNNRYINFIVVESIIILFVIMEGMTVSVIRSAVMITLINSGLLFKRKADTYNSLGIATILLTAFSPFTVRDVSFILSVAGVFGIGVVAPFVTKGIKFKGIVGNTIKTFATMVCVTIVILPLSAVYFDEISVISPFANILLIPLCTISLLCGIVVVCTGGISIIATPMFFISGLCNKIVLFIADNFSALKFSYIEGNNSFIIYLTFTSAAILLFTYFYFKRPKSVAICTISLIIICYFTYGIEKIITKDEIIVAMLGNGSCSSVVVTKGEKATVISLALPRKNIDYTAKYLARMGIKEVNILILTDDRYSGEAVYNDQMTIKVNDVIVVGEHNNSLSYKVCNCKPSYMNNNITIDTKNYIINVNDGTVEIDCDNRKILIVDDDVSKTATRSIYIEEDGVQYMVRQDNKDGGYQINLNNKDNIIVRRI